MNRVVVSAGLLALAGAALAVWWWQQPAASDGGWNPAPVTVAVATVTERPLVVPVTSVGVLEARQQVAVSADSAGRITRLAFEPGQSVRAGQLLVELLDARERAELQQWQARLKQAAQRRDRTRTLLAQNVASREQMEQADMEHDTALAGVAEAQARRAEKQLRAPFSGRTGLRRVHLGQYLQPGEAVTSLVAEGPLKVVFSVDEQDGIGLRVGQPVTVRVDALAGQPFEARISALEPWVSSARTLRAEALLETESAALVPGLSATVSVWPQQSAPVAVVPESAITYSAYGETLFVVEDDAGTPRVRRVAVTVGARREGWAVLERGAEPGSVVVTSGQLNLSDGVAVAPREHDSLNADQSALGAQP
ncbi:efflux RND transporter periplasmic adaptor subunit [Isoalcanivorax beigongshangi]|uniref:Efflux RND transporter periplasmic adaptor subunit n=1 Tax=Isoalcanivorax beigongshangi TaxID=3238810 RepID=A0ABV4AEL2_9GAMM